VNTHTQGLSPAGTASLVVVLNFFDSECRNRTVSKSYPLTPNRSGSQDVEFSPEEMGGGIGGFRFAAVTPPPNSAKDLIVVVNAAVVASDAGGTSVGGDSLVAKIAGAAAWRNPSPKGLPKNDGCHVRISSLLGSPVPDSDLTVNLKVFNGNDHKDSDVHCCLVTTLFGADDSVVTLRAVQEPAKGPTNFETSAVFGAKQLADGGYAAGQFWGINSAIYCFKETDSGIVLECYDAEAAFGYSVYGSVPQ
jgi:hypothetical protein